MHVLLLILSSPGSDEKRSRTSYVIGIYTQMHARPGAWG